MNIKHQSKQPKVWVEGEISSWNRLWSLKASTNKILAGSVMIMLGTIEKQKEKKTTSNPKTINHAGASSVARQVVPPQAHPGRRVGKASRFLGHLHEYFTSQKAECYSLAL